MSQKKKKFRVDKEQFDFERNEAFKSRSIKRVRRFMEKHDLPIDPDAAGFLGGIHKAITGIVELPLALRLESKKWLNLHGMTSFDDGTLGRILSDAEKKTKQTQDGPKEFYKPFIKDENST